MSRTNGSSADIMMSVYNTAVSNIYTSSELKLAFFSV